MQNIQIFTFPSIIMATCCNTKDTKHPLTSSVRCWFRAWHCSPAITALFYCRVSLFDWRSYLNRKEIGPPSAFESMKVVNTTFYTWEIQILNLLNHGRIESIIRAELNYEEHWHVLFLNKRTRRIVSFYAEPCRAEKPVQADKKNMLWTELVRGCLAAHLIHNVEKWWQKPSKIILFFSPPQL